MPTMLGLTADAELLAGRPEEALDLGGPRPVG
jgi:hypothetical protein